MGDIFWAQENANDCPLSAQGGVAAPDWQTFSINTNGNTIRNTEGNTNGNTNANTNGNTDRNTNGSTIRVTKNCPL